MRALDAIATTGELDAADKEEGNGLSLTYFCMKLHRFELSSSEKVHLPKGTVAVFFNPDLTLVGFAALSQALVQSLGRS